MQETEHPPAPASLSHCPVSGPPPVHSALIDDDIIHLPPPFHVNFEDDFEALVSQPPPIDQIDAPPMTTSLLTQPTEYVNLLKQGMKNENPGLQLFTPNKQTIGFQHI
jgi:hypothetical protein